MRYHDELEQLNQLTTTIYHEIQNSLFIKKY